MFRPPKPETIARNAERFRKEREERSKALIARTIESYLNHPDNEYAEIMYGDPLREMGIEPPKRGDN